MGLAIFGSKPKYKKPLYIIKPFLPTKREIYKIIDTLDKNRILTNDGPFVKKFEEKLKHMLGIKHIVLVSSGTSGLQLLIRALGLKGEVLLPSFTFVASAHVLSWEGIKPVFVDIEKDSFTINPDLLNDYLTEKTSAVMGVHLFGNPCAIEKLEHFCKKRKLKLIFDAAQALGCSYKGEMIGRFGDAEVFSLHATKIINSFEGGFIATNNSDLYRKLVLMRNFGFVGYDRVESIGINAKMSEFSAAIGLANLKSLKRNIEANKKNHILYNSYLKDIPNVLFPRQQKDCGTNYNNYHILIDERYGISRDQLCDILWKENIIARRYYFPGCHNLEPYRSQNQNVHQHLPITEKISCSIICLPCFPGLKEKDITIISGIIREAYDQKDEVSMYYQHRKVDPWIYSVKT